MKKHVAAVFACALVFGVAACGDDDDAAVKDTTTTTEAATTTTSEPVATTTSTTVPPVDLCALLPEADIERITGLTLEATPDPPDGCDFFNELDSAHAVRASQSPIDWADACGGYTPSQPVEALGDAACAYVLSDAGAVAINVWAKDFEWTVGISYPVGSDAEFPVEQVIEMAQILITNLR